MNKIFDPVTRAQLLQEGGRFIVHFEQKGCAGLTLTLESLSDQNTPSGMQEYVERPSSSEEPIYLYTHQEHSIYLDDARITRTEKKNKVVYIYTSKKVKSRCGCGKSFGFEEKKVQSKHEKLTDKLQNIKNSLKKKASILTHHENTIIDHGERTEETIRFTQDGQVIHYYLILKNHEQVTRRIESIGEGQEIHISLLVLEDETHDTSRHSIEMIADISGSKTKLISNSLTLSARSGHTRVLSGIRVLGGKDQDAHISQRSILLRDTASIAAIPLLDVHTPGSHAEHSATIESISDEELFYLESRGIPTHHATKIKLISLVRSMIDDSIMSDEELESDIARLIA